MLIKNVSPFYPTKVQNPTKILSRQEILVYSSINHTYPKGLIFPRGFLALIILSLGGMLCQLFSVWYIYLRMSHLRVTSVQKNWKYFDQSNIINSFEMHPPWILSELGGKCYSLGPSPRSILAIRTTSGSIAGFTWQGRILVEYYLSTSQVITNTGSACALVQP